MFLSLQFAVFFYCIFLLHATLLTTCIKCILVFKNTQNKTRIHSMLFSTTSGQNVQIVPLTSSTRGQIVYVNF